MENSSDSPARLTLRQAIELGVEMLDTNRLAEAEQILSAVLQAHPASPDALHFMGLLRCQQERAEEAIALIRRSIEIAPTYAEAHHNLGNILRAMNRPQEALVAFRRTIELAPDVAEAYSSSADILRRAGRRAEAVPFYLRALALQPALAEAYFQLGKIYYRLGNPAQAEATFRKWLEVDSTNPVARHMVAAIGSAAAPDRASDGYVRCEFDDFADTFDDVMTTIGYDGPRQIAAALKQEIAPDRSLNILDAGCGTGLVGEAVRAWKKHLTGVDLSLAMINRARQRGCYDELFVSELTSFADTTGSRFDLVVSADTFIYFGLLSAVFRGISRALRPGGHFIFTTEHLKVENESGFFLQPSGRYSHYEKYIRQCLNDAGLKILRVTEEVVRLELSDPVAGLTVTAVKSTEES